MDHVAEILSVVAESTDNDSPGYVDVFRNAIRRTPPVFFRQKYADFFWQCATSIRGWLPRVVVACATTESSGSRALADIWSRVDYNKDAEAGLLEHAKDESRHARMFVELGRLAFAKAYDANVLDAVAECLSPSPKNINKNTGCLISEETLIDYIVQLNIVEIRTRLHLHFLAPVYYACAPPTARIKVESILRSLARDEASHVSYTAGLIDSWAQTGDRKKLAELYSLRLSDYNEHTIAHCDKAIHDYGQGLLPDLIGD